MSKKITTKEVKYTAGLARLELSETEEKKFAEDLNNILGYFDDLEQADTNNFAKFNHYELISEKKNHFREDELAEDNEKVREIIKDNFPSKQGNLLAVKAILKKK